MSETVDLAHNVKSPHLSDPTLKPFLQSTFDPADFFNATLPTLAINTATNKGARRQSSADKAVPLSELASTTQTLLSQLNAQTTRLSSVLTQLTDDILRSGGRLAYQVEVLRGETIGLTEVLTEKIQDDIAKFAPEGLLLNADEEALKSPASPVDVKRESGAGANEVMIAARGGKPSDHDSEVVEPPYINQLRILTLVRSRLESVMQVFGEAMKWTLPPSEVSFTSSLVSVSAPEPGSDGHSREEQGKAFAEALRREISDLITGENPDPTAATARIQALRDLADVWKGTTEEKARIKFVESLVRLAEEKQKSLEASKHSARPGQRERKSSQGQQTAQSTQKMNSNKSGGFLENLSRMRGNIYMES